MADSQRITVVSAVAGPEDVGRLRRCADRGALVLTAPTAEAKGVAESAARAVAGSVKPELELAPVRFPDVDRGHRLDALVREHALVDRFRDVVVVADPATVTLLLRVLAPNQLASGGPVTVVGLPRAEPPISFGRALGLGGGIGVLSVVLQLVVPILVLPIGAAVAGVSLLAVPSRRRTGRELLLAAVVGLFVLIMLVASSRRFPATM
ncbi:hypothetical protein [Nocardioides sp.]|uniref:hypothetical protein n=1 Tax=Nocardioides sp. TaxID=35761 RepID=UPI0035123278